MRHIIVHLIRGEAKRVHEAITRNLAERFDSFPIHERIPPHLTLKRWFEIEEDGMDDIRGVLDTFAKTHSKSAYVLGGFSHFDTGVIYVDVKPSEKMNSDVKELISTLKNIKGLTFDEFDNRETVFHATVAMRALKPFDFDQLWNYLQTTKLPSFQMNFDNVALMRKESETWITEQVWELGS